MTVVAETEKTPTTVSGGTPPEPPVATAPMPQPNDATPPATATTAAPSENPEQPPRGPSRAHSLTASPSAADVPTPAATDPASADPSTTADTAFSQQLTEADEHWALKVGIRSFVCVMAAVGIACAAWVTANGLWAEASQWRPGYLDDKSTALGALITLSVSLVWGIAEMLTRFIRRPPRPIHPGVIVGADLLIAIGLLTALIYAIPATMSFSYFGEDPNYLIDPVDSWDYNGNYYLDRSTDTWVYNMTTFYPTANLMLWNGTSGEWYYPATIPGDQVQRDCRGRWDYGFDDCAAQDAFVNGLWRQKPARLAADALVCAAELLALLGHAALFVWACVDTHRRNRLGPARLLAREMLADLIDRGDVVLLRGDLDHHLGRPGRPPAPQPAEFTPVPAHLLRRRARREDPAHWESRYEAYDPVDRPRGQGRRGPPAGPHVPFQHAPYVLPYGRRAPGYRTKPGPLAGGGPPDASDEKKERYF